MGVLRCDQVAAAVTGERVALQQLLATAQPFVTRYCRARIGQRHGGSAADELARQVLSAVLDALPYYREQDGPFLSFVYRIAAPLTDARGAVCSPPLDPLPPQQREILVLRTVIGLSAAETATVLGCTDARVRLLQHRALNAIRASLPPPTGNRPETGQRQDHDRGDLERGCDGARFRPRPRRD